MRKFVLLGALLVFGFVAGTGDARAQQVTVATPFHSLSDGFFENMGTSWRLNGPGWNLSFGGSPTQAAPQFGGFDPSAGASFGFAGAGGRVNGQLSANWSQGYRQSFVTQTPSITLPNGGTGYVSDTSQSPFVISYIPVVGGFPTVGVVQPIMPPMAYGPAQPAWMNPAVMQALQRQAAGQNRWQANNVAPEAVPRDGLGEIRPEDFPAPIVGQAQAPKRPQEDLVLVGPGVQPKAAGGQAGKGVAEVSAAGQPAPSVTAARAMFQQDNAQPNSDAMGYWQRGQNAEASGKPGVAKIYYQMALRRASGPLKDQILARLQALSAGQPPK